MGPGLVASSESVEVLFIRLDAGGYSAIAAGLLHSARHPAHEIYC